MDDMQQFRKDNIPEQPALWGADTKGGSFTGDDLTGYQAGHRNGSGLAEDGGTETTTTTQPTEPGRVKQPVGAVEEGIQT